MSTQAKKLNENALLALFPSALAYRGVKAGSLDEFTQTGLYYISPTYETTGMPYSQWGVLMVLNSLMIVQVYFPMIGFNILFRHWWQDVWSPWVQLEGIQFTGTIY